MIRWSTPQLRAAVDVSTGQLAESRPAPTARVERSLRPVLQLLSVREFAWTQVTLSWPGLPAGLDGLRIVHLSDAHFHRAWFPAHDRLVARLRLDPPDLVLITGDLVDSKVDPTDEWPLAERMLRGMRARCGVYAIHGNHDGDLVVPRLPALGVAVLTHRRVVVPIGDNGAGAIELIGLPGTDRDDCDQRMIAGVPPKAPGVPRVVMAHFPDLIRQCHSLAPDLVLAGHTHGGQVCLPGGIPIIRHDSLPRRLDTGVHRVEDTWLIVSRGMGFSSYPVRLFCPAEVIEIRLQRAD